MQRGSGCPSACSISRMSGLSIHDAIVDTMSTELARAVQYLHGQGRSAWTHELVVTPVGDRWTP